MKKLFLRVGSFLVYNKTNGGIRRGIVFLFTQLILLIGVLFLLELVFIFLGINDVFLPFTRPVKDLLEKALF